VKINLRIATSCGAGLAAAALLAGCGADAPLASGPAATATTVRGSGASTTVAGPQSPPCTTGDLTVTGVQQTATAATIFLELIVSIKGQVACSVVGYAGFALRGGPTGGTALPATPVHAVLDASVPMGVAPFRFELSPGGLTTVAFYVEVPQKGPSGECRTATGFEFSAPSGQSWSPDVTFAAHAGGPAGGASSITACGRSLAESAFQTPMLVDLTG
jgi:hypothetical protein